MSTFNQSHVIVDRDARDRWVNSGDHGDRCAVCHRPLSAPDFLGFAPHHIIHTLGMVLSIKSATAEWNPERLEGLYHRPLPDLEKLPEYYCAERERWGGSAEITTKGT